MDFWSFLGTENLFLSCARPEEVFARVLTAAERGFSPVFDLRKSPVGCSTLGSV